MDTELHLQQDVTVINLSRRPISTECELALSKGLNFIPTTQCNAFDTKIDFEKFFRNLRLKEFYGSIDKFISGPISNEAIADACTPFRPKSTFCPPKYRNASLDTYCRLVERDVTNIITKSREYKVYNNLPKAQREALIELKKDTTIIIKPADKGGAICIMNRDDYVKEIYGQLANTIFYEKLENDPTRGFKIKID